MQTFLHYTSPHRVAATLDNKRLGKQRVEGNQILDILEGRADNNWKHHPAVRMWRGYENALKYYINIVIMEWERRGCVNNMELHDVGDELITPPWFRDLRLQYSHRSNLIRKLPEYYQCMWPEVRDDAPYWWPVELKGKKKQAEIEEYWGKYYCVRAFDHPNQIRIMEDLNEQSNTAWNYPNY